MSVEKRSLKSCRRMCQLRSDPGRRQAIKKATQRPINVPLPTRFQIRSDRMSRPVDDACRSKKRAPGVMVELRKGGRLVGQQRQDAQRPKANGHGHPLARVAVRGPAASHWTLNCSAIEPGTKWEHGQAECEAEKGAMDLLS